MNKTDDHQERQRHMQNEGEDEVPQQGPVDKGVVDDDLEGLGAHVGLFGCLGGGLYALVGGKAEG